MRDHNNFVVYDASDETTYVWANRKHDCLV